MTTKVTIDAHAGWPVAVTTMNPQTREIVGHERIEPGEVRDIYIHDGCELHVAELPREAG